jgi:hypothetical protein
MTHAVVTESQQPSTSFMKLLTPDKPIATRRSNRKRKTTDAVIITSSPYKKSLESSSKTQFKGQSLASGKGKGKGVSKNPRRSCRKIQHPDKLKTYHCIICKEKFVDPPHEPWIMCSICEDWAHEQCTAYSGQGPYICDYCIE